MVQELPANCTLYVLTLDAECFTFVKLRMHDPSQLHCLLAFGPARSTSGPYHFILSSVSPLSSPVPSACPMLQCWHLPHADPFFSVAAAWRGALVIGACLLALGVGAAVCGALG
eukprot:scaffold312934_cov24-Tisochrysis_lutea.AAC.1